MDKLPVLKELSGGEVGTHMGEKYCGVHALKNSVRDLDHGMSHFPRVNVKRDVNWS